MVEKFCGKDAKKDHFDNQMEFRKRSTTLRFVKEFMKIVRNFLRLFFVRFRYPVSLPEDVAQALGIELSNSITFSQFVEKLIAPTCKPTRLSKFMPRDLAEGAFFNALRKEKFKLNTLCSYYFSEGWVEFILQFDGEARLRRIYVNHKTITKDEGVEIPL